LGNRVITGHHPAGVIFTKFAADFLQGIGTQSRASFRFERSEGKQRGWPKAAEGFLKLNKKFRSIL
jgi:hypothetical protein